MPKSELPRLLNALEEGIEARAVGLFDASRGRLHAASTIPTHDFWDAFDGVDCLNVDWGDWDRELLMEGRTRVPCGCGRHAVGAYLVQGRWALIVFEDGPLITGAEAVIANAFKILHGLLPARRAKNESASPEGGGANPGEGGIPIWWARRRASS